MGRMPNFKVNGNCQYLCGNPSRILVMISLRYSLLNGSIPVPSVLIFLNQNSIFLQHILHTICYILSVFLNNVGLFPSLVLNFTILIIYVGIHSQTIHYAIPGIFTIYIPLSLAACFRNEIC